MSAFSIFRIHDFSRYHVFYLGETFAITTSAIKPHYYLLNFQEIFSFGSGRAFHSQSLLRLLLRKAITKDFRCNPSRNPPQKTTFCNLTKPFLHLLYAKFKFCRKAFYTSYSSRSRLGKQRRKS